MTYEQIAGVAYDVYARYEKISAYSWKQCTDKPYYEAEVRNLANNVPTKESLFSLIAAALLPFLDKPDEKLAPPTAEPQIVFLAGDWTKAQIAQLEEVYHKGILRGKELASVAAKPNGH